MLKSLKLLVAASAFAMIATPAVGQSVPEEARTTYSVTLLKFADGADERFTEILTDIVTPAQVAAGQTPDVVHWVMGNPAYDLIIVSHMPGGMASFDRHNDPHQVAFFGEMTRIVGGEAQFEALGEEYDSLVESEVTYFTHTHP